MRRPGRRLPFRGERVLRVAIAGGGTGGHVFPAIAVAEALVALRSSTRILLIGSIRGVERRLGLWNRYETVFTEAPRAAFGTFRLAASCVESAAALARCYGALSRFRPHVVIGAGGYASVAPVLAARALCRPVILLEQNVIPGRANRLLARLADEVHTQFEASVVRFPATSRVRVTGNPVRRKVLEAARRRWRRPAQAPLTLFVMGGSQGASSMNRAVVSALPYLARACPDMRVFHVAGPRDVETARARLYACGLKGKVWDFCRIPEELYAVADLAVFRAGATAIAELSACGVPAILVPYPHAKDGHQHANADVLSRAGACELLEDSRLDGRVLADRVLALARDPARRARMSAAMRAFARPEAARMVARRAETLAGFAAPLEVPVGVRRRPARHVA